MEPPKPKYWPWALVNLGVAGPLAFCELGNRLMMLGLIVMVPELMGPVTVGLMVIVALAELAAASIAVAIKAQVLTCLSMDASLLFARATLWPPRVIAAFVDRQAGTCRDGCHFPCFFC